MRNIFKQLHIWLSIPLGLVISITCFSGAALIFEKEITESVQSRYYYVDNVKESALPIDEIISRVEPTIDEGVKITGITIPNDPARSYKVNLSKPKHAAVYVDQYTGEVKGRPERLGFFRTMFSLHRWLMDSKPADGGIFWGKLIVGISTLMMVIIILTGVVIWWPKNRHALKHRVSIKLRKGWHRFWYDLHVAGGIYATLLILIMALTGLTWSFEWYRNGVYGLFGIETKKESNSSDKGDKGNRDGKRNRGEASEDEAAASPYIMWQDVYEEVLAANPDTPEITLSEGSATVKLGGVGNQRASDKYKFDNATGEITAIERYADADSSGKMRGWLYSLHVGNWGGIVTRILWLLAALIGATLPLTGYYLWMRRMLRKRKERKSIEKGKICDAKGEQTPSKE